jgi:hypothetical protein
MKPILRQFTVGLGIVGFTAALSVVPAAAQEDNGGYVKAYGSPGDAGVFINGKYAGPAHRFSLSEKYGAPADQVEVTFREAQYEDYTTKVDVSAHKTTKVHYKMKKLPTPKPPFGRLKVVGGEPDSFMSVTTGDAGAIYLNDKFVGYVDQMNNPGSAFLINPGTYNVFIDSPHFGQIHQTVNIQANKTSVIKLQQGK